MFFSNCFEFAWIVVSKMLCYYKPILWSIHFQYKRMTMTMTGHRYVCSSYCTPLNALPKKKGPRMDFNISIGWRNLMPCLETQCTPKYTRVHYAKWGYLCLQREIQHECLCSLVWEIEEGGKHAVEISRGKSNVLSNLTWMPWLHMGWRNLHRAYMNNPISVGRKLIRATLIF